MITLENIQDLRAKTGAGVMDCKAALTEANGDIEKAFIILRKKGLASLTDRESKTASEGTIGYYIHAGSKIGVMVELNAETDFVARSEPFTTFAKELAMHIAAANPKYITRADVPEAILTREKDIFSQDLIGKPPQMIEKIVAGKMNKVFKELCLMEQPFVRDQNITIADLFGSLAAQVKEKIVIKRFMRFVVGE